MNKHDLDNLRFLLNADPGTLAYWYAECNDDDIMYASELMTQYASELAVKKRFNEVDHMDLTNLTSDAEFYLQRFKLKK